MSPTKVKDILPKGVYVFTIECGKCGVEGADATLHEVSIYYPHEDRGDYIRCLACITEDWPEFVEVIQ